MITPEDHLRMFRNTLTATEEGRYVLGQLLIMLNFFDPCESEADTALCNTGLELLENCGMIFHKNATAENAEKSITNFVEAISKLDVTPLVEDQAKKEQAAKKAKEDNLV